MADNLHDSEKLLTPSEVAAIFRVDPKTVTRWAKVGKLSSIRTLGGHRRFREQEQYIADFQSRYSDFTGHLFDPLPFVPCSTAAFRNRKVRLLHCRRNGLSECRIFLP